MDFARCMELAELGHFLAHFGNLLRRVVRLLLAVLSSSSGSHSSASSSNSSQSSASSSGGASTASDCFAAVSSLKARPLSVSEMA